MVALVLNPRIAPAKHGKGKKGSKTQPTVANPPQTPVVVVTFNPRRAHLIGEQTPLAKILKKPGKREYRFRILCVLAYPNADQHTKMTAVVYAKMAELHPEAYEGSTSIPETLFTGS
jgi:hypothetical protein